MVLPVLAQDDQWSNGRLAQDDERYRGSTVLAQDDACVGSKLS